MKRFNDKTIQRIDYKTETGYKNALQSLHERKFKENAKGLAGLKWEIEEHEEDATLYVEVSD